MHIRKRDQNTQWVAGLLAQLAGIKRNDVSFCGLKDRFAVTTQWYSLYLPGKELSSEQLQHSDFDILAMARNNKKLRRGMHAGNAFRLVLKEFALSTSITRRLMPGSMLSPPLACPTILVSSVLAITVAIYIRLKA